MSEKFAFFAISQFWEDNADSIHQINNPAQFRQIMEAGKKYGAFRQKNL